MKWIIKSVEGYWNNWEGWTYKSEATVFTNDEKNRFHLPIGKKVQWVIA